ncbi:MAG: DUF3488 domain-containing transglutaminase family protein [Deltaproteobacteria bacterium]|nr:DUF3488 domain-containing transglutaminase family protein [Deltaproteobacteria bacterium]
MALQARADMELWDRPFQTLLLAVLAVNIASHVLYVPWWILALSVTSLGWKLGHLYKGWVLPPKRWLYLAAAAVGSVVIWEYKTAFGHEAATPTLVFLASIKLLETNRDRDAMFVIITSYFLLMAHLLHSQSLASTFFMAFDVAIITILMYQLHRADRRISSSSLRPVVQLLVLTIPIWLLLFVVFPRFNLTMLRTNRPVQTVGFSEELSPGSVASLAQTNETAFRVKFLSGPKRNPELLYWRGATLYHSDGLSWKPRTESEIEAQSSDIGNLMLGKSTEKEIASLSEKVLSYQIIAEPAAGRAVFTLPRVVKFEPAGAMLFQRPYVTKELMIRLSTTRADHMTYSAASVLEDEGDLETIDAQTYRLAAALPKELSPKVINLFEELSKNSTSPHRAVKNLDEWFHAQDFRYTLEPGQSQAKSLDDFLFSTKKGFCEHFASASAVLLRGMGHPARVVVGYQGGRLNQFSKALIVQSRDAHAWVEVWFPSRDNPREGRWLTYDPTALIAPLRLRMGGDYFDLTEEQRQSENASDAEILKMQRNLALRAFQRVDQIWDYAQMTWSQFLLNYDRSGQQNLLNELLKVFGIKPSPAILTVLIGFLFMIMLRIVFIWNNRAPSESRVKKEWQALEKELSKKGIYQGPKDGPLTLRSRVSHPIVLQGIDAFIEIQYGKLSDKEYSKNEAQIRKIRAARVALRRQSAPT